MPRSARKESGYGIYHVMMRGINRQAIFDDDEDCRRFMDILADLPRLPGVSSGPCVCGRVKDGEVQRSKSYEHLKEV